MLKHSDNMKRDDREQDYNHGDVVEGEALITTNFNVIPLKEVGSSVSGDLGLHLKTSDAFSSCLGT